MRVVKEEKLRKSAVNSQPWLLILYRTADHHDYYYFFFVFVFWTINPFATENITFFFFVNPPVDGEKKSFSSPHFHAFLYMSCVDLTQLPSHSSAS